MPAVTNSQFLPYQVGTDRRCDAPVVWREFVETVETRLTPLALLGNRLRDVPMAFVEWFAPDLLTGVAIDVLQTQWGSNSVNWTNVTVDTDNMVDLDADHSHVTPTRPGVYHQFGMLRFLQPFTVGASYGLSLSGGAGDGSVAVDFYLSRTFTSTFFWFNTEPGTRYNPTDVTGSRTGYWNPEETGVTMIEGFELNLTGDSAARLSYASMGVIWHSELQV